jgi:hypothetical protein
VASLVLNFTGSGYNYIHKYNVGDSNDDDDDDDDNNNNNNVVCLLWLNIIHAYSVINSLCTHLFFLDPNLIQFLYYVNFCIGGFTKCVTFPV